jgi:hypothetical protein
VRPGCARGQRKNRTQILGRHARLQLAGLLLLEGHPQPVDEAELPAARHAAQIAAAAAGVAAFNLQAAAPRCCPLHMGHIPTSGHGSL